MSTDFLERNSRATRDKKLKKVEKSLHSIVSEIHIDVYGQPTKDLDNSYFMNQLNKIMVLTGEENFKAHFELLIRRYMEHNRDFNEPKFAGLCTIDMMTNQYALAHTWPQLIKDLGLEKPKKVEKATREYYGIEEHPLYLILNTGLAQTKVMKSKCYAKEKDGVTYYYPKDNRLRTQFDFDGLQEFLELPKEYDFGTVPEIDGVPCFGFYVCSAYPKSCSYKCGKFKKLKYLFRASEIPEKYLYPIPYTESPQVKESPNMVTQVLLDIKENIVEYVNEGENFVFFSAQTGTGKTSWACTIAKHFIFRRMMKNMLEPEAVYINVSEYFATLKSAFGLKDENLNIQILQLNNLIKDVPLLVIDDLGAEKGTEYTRDTLYQIINYRYSNKLSTIYTTNLPLDSKEAEEHLGKRIISRMMESTVIDFDKEVK